jgi:hypothetical protein
MSSISSTLENGNANLDDVFFYTIALSSSKTRIHELPRAAEDVLMMGMGEDIHKRVSMCTGDG